MEDIIAQARELGKKIAGHERTKSFMTAAKAVAEDKDAQAVLKNYQENIEKIRSLEAAGKPIEVDDKKKMQQAETAVAGNDKLKQMMKHQADYLEMMHRINSAIDEAAQTLSQVKVDDVPVTVERIQMPPRRDGKWRTYTNVIYANGVLLVPQYPDYSPELDAKALEVYRKVLPDWKVVGVNASTLIEKRGSLHCLSHMLPVMTGLRTAN